MDEFVVQIPKATLNAYKGNYLVREMTEARKYLIETIYKKRSFSKTELTCKLKCGILTPDVIDYFVHENEEPLNDKDILDIKEKSVELRDKFKEQFEIDEFLEGEIEEFRVFNPRTNLKISNLLPRSKRIKIFDDKSDAENICPLGLTQIQIKSEKNSVLNKIDKSTNNVKKNSEKLNNMRHECESNCTKNISIFKAKYLNTLDRNTFLEVVFVCDVCLSIFRDQKMVFSHIDELNHISASIFLREKSSIVNKSELKYIVNRCSIKSLKNTFATGVFCPNRECSFFFGFTSTSILACGLHYQYFHNSSEQIFSRANLKNELTFEMKKIHECVDCKMIYKKLSDLVLHLRVTGHFPHSSSNEINLLVCPSENCKFKSTNFHIFKMHVRNHPASQQLFNNTSSSDSKAKIKVLIYTFNSGYSHFPSFRNESKDNKHELEAIENLLELNKPFMQVPGFVDLNSRLSEQKFNLTSQNK